MIKTFYNWHNKLKKRRLANPDPAPTVFHRVTIQPTETPTIIEEVGISLRFRLPNGIDCEVTDITLANYAGFLDTLSRLRP